MIYNNIINEKNNFFFFRKKIIFLPYFYVQSPLFLFILNRRNMNILTLNYKEMSVFYAKT